MIYPIPIMWHSGDAAENYQYPLWVDIIWFIGFGISVIGTLAILGMLVHGLITNDGLDEELIGKSMALILIGMMILIMSLVLMFITGKPLEE